MLDPFRRQFFTLYPATRNGSIPHPVHPQTGLWERWVVLVLVLVIFVLVARGHLDPRWADLILWVWLR
ncbi:hypothetical protein [Streptomyces uncialis]|uniref:hypothetical protein n=1 Tax=Streptomyces uncialis TaxID=1048205 RepID=UPI0022566A7A|nr:hypothetical protein [Streptomyces uncialis]MCX4659138.1 hypothetical protein [Streptomyces uncialis]